MSVWLGLAACGLPGATPAPITPERPRAPLYLRLRSLVPRLRELAVAVMIVVMVSETIFIQDLAPRFLKHEQPFWIKQLVAYPRLIQAWSMFASDAPTTDESVVVDAVTIEGRHVDPYSEVASRYARPGTAEIPARLDNDSFFFNYSARIPFKAEYWTAFQEWLLAYHERTGRAQDRIIKFDAYIVEDDSPPPGQKLPRNVHSRAFLSYPPKR